MRPSVITEGVVARVCSTDAAGGITGAAKVGLFDTRAVTTVRDVDGTERSSRPG
jgi:hypothetical protein